MSAIAVTAPAVRSVWPRMFRSGSERLAALADRALFGSHQPPPPDCGDHVLSDPETQLMIALICAMQI